MWFDHSEVFSLLLFVERLLLGAFLVFLIIGTTIVRILFHLAFFNPVFNSLCYRFNLRIPRLKFQFETYS